MERFGQNLADLQDADFYKRFALNSFYHLSSTIIELTVANFLPILNASHAN